MNTTPAEIRNVKTLLRCLGETVSEATARALAVEGLPPASSAAIGELENLGLQLQSLARVSSGAGRLAPERIDLGLALMQLKAEWLPELQRRGATLDSRADGVEIRVCAGVFKQAADLALGHVLALGRHIHGSVELHGEPALPTLVFTVLLPGQELFGVSREALDELHWELLVVLCDQAGVRLERQVEAQQVEIRLGFVPEV